MFTLSKEPSKKRFKELMSECFLMADVFSLRELQYESVENDELFHQLKPYLIEQREVRHWFSFYVPEGYSLKIFLFRVCEESKSIMMELYPSLFLGENDWPWALQDVCFFSNKKLFLGTVSHEYMCFLYPPTEEIASRFNTICKWKQEEDELAEQIEI